MRTHPAEDRMRPGVGEARCDARELERRLEEALPQRLPRQIVVSEACRPLEADAAERLAPARVLGDQDSAVVDEVVAGVALLDQESKSEEKISTRSSTSRADSPVRSTASNSERCTVPLTTSTRTSGTVSARPTRQPPFAGRAAKESHGLAS